MKQIVTLIFILAVGLGTAMGAGNTSTIGYSHDEIAKTCNYSLPGNRYVSGAIYLPGSVLQPYDGCRVLSLRAAMVSKINVDVMTVWLSTSLDSETPLLSYELTASSNPALAKGWIEIPVEDNFELSATEGLYLGMTYHQKAEAKVFSLTGNGYPNSFFVRDDKDSDWSDMSSEGILGIEMVVEGEADMPFDLALTEASIDYSSDPSANIVIVGVRNSGQNPVSGFTLSTQDISISEPAEEHYFDFSLQPGDKAQVECRIAKSADVFDQQLCVSLASIDDGEDADPSNNTIIARAGAVKKVLIEEFTTEKCSNCPRVAKYIDELTEDPVLGSRTVVLCHHAGFYTDWLTQDCDEAIGWLYGGNYAPAIMYDRSDAILGSLAHTPSQADLHTIVEQAIAQPAGVAINIIPDVVPDKSKVHLTISIKRQNLDMNSPRLSVYLTEDNITPRFQAGDDGTHIHQHVIRAYNSTWGDQISWNGSNYAAEYTFDLDPSWKYDDLRVLAFVNNYDETNPYNNMVDNVEISTLSNSTGVDAVAADNIPVCEEWYDLTGRRVSPETKGILIHLVRRKDGSCSSTKVIR